MQLRQNNKTPVLYRHKRIEPHAVQKGKFVAIMR